MYVCFLLLLLLFVVVVVVVVVADAAVVVVVSFLCLCCFIGSITKLPTKTYWRAGKPQEKEGAKESVTNATLALIQQPRWQLEYSPSSTHHLES